MHEANVLLPVWDTIGIAWRKVSGSKASFWAAIGIVILVGILFGILGAIVKNMPFISNGVFWVQQFVNYLLQTGILYIGIRRALDMPITYRQMFRSFEEPYLWRLIFSYVFQILLMLPFIILMIAGVVLLTVSKIAAILCIIAAMIGLLILGVRLCLTPAFILDKDKGPWEGIKTSFHATRGNFWRLIGLFILEVLILFIAAIPLLIPLIWVLPLLFIIYGEIYKALLPNVMPVVNA